MRISRILVANRGEIACRVIRSARSLGYETIAVHSDADASSPHVRLADGAVRIGPAAVAESYLDVDRIMAAAQQSGADALHPGYGFLSENPALAEACSAAGIVFVGPPAAAIRAMADKGAARRRMAAAGVDCVPGHDEPDATDEMLMTAASRIGFPLMIKAAAGGGGRGMRVVRDADAMAAALGAARSEGLAAFGSDALILERAIERPRHVEVQVFADDHGTIVHLGERDCSVQRRHQKVIEEAPGPTVTAELRAALGRAAVAAARAIDYRGAGTVEFLLERRDGQEAFFFLEMNTRLQVEHPVTEAITGLDLVALQFRVAEGLPLGFCQEDVRLDGWAIEARLYAEDPHQSFLPATGTLQRWISPRGAGVRVDAGIESGSVVTPHYDPLLAKIIASGPTRDVARRRLRRALGDTVALGVTTNRDFLGAVLGDERFAGGEATTAFIDETWPDGVPATAPDDRQLAAAAVLDMLAARDAAVGKSVGVPAMLLGWSSGRAAASRRAYVVGEERRTVAVLPQNRDDFLVRIGERELSVRVVERSAGVATLVVDGVRLTCHWLVTPDGVRFADAASTFRLARPGTHGAASEAGDGERVRAPMHGLVTEVDVAVGDPVAAGDRLLVLEAMKMQQEIRARIAGTVVLVEAAAGRQVAAGDLVVEIELAPQAGEEP